MLRDFNIRIRAQKEAIYQAKWSLTSAGRSWAYYLKLEHEQGLREVLWRSAFQQVSNIALNCSDFVKAMCKDSAPLDVQKQLDRVTVPNTSSIGLSDRYAFEWWCLPERWLVLKILKRLLLDVRHGKFYAIYETLKPRTIKDQAVFVNFMRVRVVRSWLKCGISSWVSCFFVIDLYDIGIWVVGTSRSQQKCAWNRTKPHLRYSWFIRS